MALILLCAFAQRYQALWHLRRLPQSQTPCSGQGKLKSIAMSKFLWQRLGLCLHASSHHFQLLFVLKYHTMALHTQFTVFFCSLVLSEWESRHQNWGDWVNGFFCTYWPLVALAWHSFPSSSFKSPCIKTEHHMITLLFVCCSLLCLRSPINRWTTRWEMHGVVIPGVICISRRISQRILLQGMFMMGLWKHSWCRLVSFTHRDISQQTEFIWP